MAVDQATALGRDLTVRGQIDSIGDVDLNGTVTGDIKARKVTLQPQAVVEGEILAEEVHIHGQLKGRITARTVVIGESARIEGQVFHHKIEVAKGAQVKGRLPWRPATYFDGLDIVPTTPDRRGRPRSARSRKEARRANRSALA